MSVDYDAKVERLVLKLLREDPDEMLEPAVHLKGCDQARVEGWDGGDGSHGCSTGCKYVELRADISCPHMAELGLKPFVYCYGEFGSMWSLLDDLDTLN